MSKYAERHQHVADCSEPGCSEPGTKLARIEGTLYWLCPGHYDDYERRTA